MNRKLLSFFLAALLLGTTSLAWARGGPAASAPSASRPSSVFSRPSAPAPSAPAPSAPAVVSKPSAPAPMVSTPAVSKPAESTTSTGGGGLQGFYQKNAGSTTSGYGSDMNKAATLQQSRENYQAAQQRQQQQQTTAQPKPTMSDYWAKRDTAQQRQIESLQRRLDRKSLENYDLRAQQRFGTVPQTVIVHHYRDPYNDNFMYWLGLQSAVVQAQWYYNHQNYMDSQRYNEALEQNTELKAQVQALEAQNARRDASYVPPGLDDSEKDLMYSKAAVQAAYDEAHPPQYSSHVLLWVLLGGLVASALIVFLVLLFSLTK